MFNKLQVTKNCRRKSLDQGSVVEERKRLGIGSANCEEVFGLLMSFSSHSSTQVINNPFHNNFCDIFVTFS